MRNTISFHDEYNENRGFYNRFDRRGWAQKQAFDWLKSQALPDLTLIGVYTMKGFLKFVNQELLVRFRIECGNLDNSNLVVS
jgi:hypothetical protein